MKLTSKQIAVIGIVVAVIIGAGAWATQIYYAQHPTSLAQNQSIKVIAREEGSSSLLLTNSNCSLSAGC